MLAYAVKNIGIRRRRTPTIHRFLARRKAAFVEARSRPRLASPSSPIPYRDIFMTDILAAADIFPTTPFLAFVQRGGRWNLLQADEDESRIWPVTTCVANGSWILSFQLSRTTRFIYTSTLNRSLSNERLINRHIDG